MFGHRFGWAAVTGRRAILGLCVASALTAATLGPPAHMGVAAEPNEPAARLQVIVQEVEILDDREGALSGTGEMHLLFSIWRCKDGVPPPCEQGSGHVTLSNLWIQDFPATTGDVLTLDRAIPGEGATNNAGEGATPQLGFPVLPGQQYVVQFGIWGADGGHVGDFIITYEIRRAPLPDLRPGKIVVHDRPGSAEKRVCMSVINSEVGHAGHFEVALQVDGVVPPGGRVAAAGLAPGGVTELCVEAALPTSGRHTLATVIDEPRYVAEFNETNNVAEVPYDATRPAPTPAPSAPLPDLIVSAIKVNGQVPDGKDDCKAGKSAVTVVVKNVGSADAGKFAVWFIPEDERSIVERSVSGLEAGREREVRFDDVRFKKGQYTPFATVDPKETVVESDEDNNSRQVTITCGGAS